MIKNPHIIEQFEREQLDKTKPDYFQNLKIFNEMYRYASSMGALPLNNPLYGIELKIKIARIVNSV